MGGRYPSPAVVAYLSREWVEALDRALATVEAPAGAEVLIVEFVVEGGDDEAAYHLELTTAGAHARPGRAARCDVRFQQPRHAAQAIARGERSAQLAVLRGEVRVEGDASRLLPWRRALTGDGVAAALAALAEVTER